VKSYVIQVGNRFCALLQQGGIYFTASVHQASHFDVFKGLAKVLNSLYPESPLDTAYRIVRVSTNVQHAKFYPSSCSRPWTSKWVTP
jgi:hypothetical protein